MSDLKLEILDDGTTDAGPGRYADKRAVDILQRYFQGRISVKDAAKQIMSMLPEDADSKTRGAEIGLFGSFICQMARQIPYKHPAQTRLVQLVQLVAKSPTFIGEGDDDGFVICYTMDDFKMQLREWWSPEFFPDEPEDVDQYLHALNFNAFLARLTQCGFLSYSSLPIWTLRESLEMTTTHQEIFECGIGTAALWMLFAGQAIYTQVVEAPPPIEAGKIYKPGSRYSGPESGLQRWKFWRDALFAVAEKKETGEECRNLAHGAVELMDVIEKNMAFQFT